ncbi:MAG: transketolase [Chloroflexota bacterium]
MAEASATGAQTQQWKELAQQLRVDSIRATTEAGSGHPTSSMSGADLAAVLLASHLRYDFGKPEHPNNDHFILSKGHAAPLLYAMYRAAGAITEQEMMSLRKLGSRIEGHPTPVLPWVDVATGSLGQGLPIGVGVALAGRYLDKAPFRVWVMLGDSEMAEGSVWEALARASDSKLGNLIGIIDVNRLGQRGPTSLEWDTATYAARARAFGWNAIEIDGHDVAQIDAAYKQAVAAASGDVPTMIVARTVKGSGFSQVADKPDWHGKALSKDQAVAALEELGGIRDIKVQVAAPPAASVAEPATVQPAPLPKYELGARMATRQAYGDALKAVGAVRQDVVAVDAEVGNSTFTETFGKAYPERHFQMYIAEQQMLATAIGMGVRKYTAFAATFAAFLARAYDFIRMAAVSRANIRLCGSHAGVSIGEDGPSQMALEDLAMMRAVGSSTVLYPSDANQTARLVEAMADLPGISYMRTTRAATAVIYGPDEQFPIGGSRVLKRSANDAVTLVGAGITLHEALKAQEELASAGIAARVIDLYSVKPIDGATLAEAARQTGGIVVAEDHWPEGGLGAAVLESLAASGASGVKVSQVAVKKIPGSGSPTELLDDCGISAKHIVAAAKALAG